MTHPGTTPTAAPPGWTVRTENGRTEYMLALFAPTAEEAEAMSLAEAQRHVVAFAEQIQQWLHGDWRTMSAAREEYNRFRTTIDGAAQGLHFEQWCALEILRIAKQERPMP